MAVHEISVSELRDLMNAAPPDAPIKLIDVREHDEWMSGHISGATLIPLGTVPERLDEFVGAPTYVICRSGGRSMHACEFVDGHGRAAVNVTGGMLAWADAGFEMTND